MLTLICGVQKIRKRMRKIGLDMAIIGKLEMVLPRIIIMEIIILFRMASVG